MIILRLALRYTCARLLHLVAVLAVALCLTVQITVMGVLDGLLEDMEKRIQGLGEQIALRYEWDPPREKEIPSAESYLRRVVPSIRGITPLIQGYAALERNSIFEPVLVSGIDLSREFSMSHLGEHLLYSHYDKTRPPTWQSITKEESSFPNMFVGREIADRLGLRPGSEVTLVYAPPGSERLIRKRFSITDILHTGNYIRDRYYIYIPLSEARTFFLSEEEGKEERVPILCIWLEDPQRARELQPVIEDALTVALGRRPSYADNWQDRWRLESQAMRHENMLQEIVMALMNLSGGFCVFAILATLVSRHIRDVGLLRCLGATRGEIVTVFLLVGLLLGLCGSLLGVIGGYGLMSEGLFIEGRTLLDWSYERLTGQKLYPPYLFEIPTFPVRLFPWKVALYAGGAVLISVIASLYPSIWGGIREPLEALRDE